MTMVVKALGYVRVSTAEQKKKGLSLAAQEALIRDYCARRGIDLVEVLRDPGVSAFKPLALRPAGAEVVARLAGGEVQAVVAVKLDRVFRNAEDCLAVVRGWDGQGVALHLVDQGGTSIDTASAMGKLLLTIMAGVAEMERNLIAERTKAVLDFKAERGERCGTVPFGSQVWIDKKRLDPNPAEQRVIAYISSLRAEGVSVSSIAKRLNAEQIPSRGARWHTTTVSRILSRAGQKAPGAVPAAA